MFYVSTLLNSPMMPFPLDVVHSSPLVARRRPVQSLDPLDVAPGQVELGPVALVTGNHDVATHVGVLQP